MTGFTRIDFSLLPPPDVVKPVDYQKLKDNSIQRLASLDDRFAGVLESDPSAKIIEVNAYDRMIDRQEVNDSARAVMLAFSRGADLDNLGVLVGCKRLVIGTDNKGKPIMESDERFKRRIQLAPEAWSVAGPREAYIYWALTLAAGITDASVFQLAPGQLQVTALGKAPNGLATEDELLKIREGFKLRGLTPLTDHLVVSQPTVKSYRIQADVWFYPGPDATLIQTKISEAMDKFLKETRKLGRDVARSAITAAIHQGGVSRVALNEPAEDIINDDRELGLPLLGINLNPAGRSE